MFHYKLSKRFGVLKRTAKERFKAPFLPSLPSFRSGRYVCIHIHMHNYIIPTKRKNMFPQHKYFRTQTFKTFSCSTTHYQHKYLTQYEHSLNTGGYFRTHRHTRTHTQTKYYILQIWYIYG